MKTGYKEALNGISGMSARSVSLILNGLIRQQKEEVKIIVVDPEQEYKDINTAVKF